MHIAYFTQFIYYYAYFKILSVLMKIMLLIYKNFLKIIIGYLRFCNIHNTYSIVFSALNFEPCV